MQRPIALLFDLDGTLIDSVGLILESMRFAFAGRAEPGPSDAEWTTGIGTPLLAQLREYARDEAEALELAARYRAYQREHHDRLTRPFPGVVETLAALRAAGHPTAIVTSKAEEIARRSVSHTGLAPLIDTVVGVESCTRHKPDPEPVHIALGRLGADATRALFVGDSPHDVTAGNAAGVATVAALWGPFSREVLAVAGPTHWLERFGDLPLLLRSLEAAAA